jgi:hypothetical protein
MALIYSSLSLSVSIKLIGSAPLVLSQKNWFGISNIGIVDGG